MVLVSFSLKVKLLMVALRKAAALTGPRLKKIIPTAGHVKLATAGSRLIISIATLDFAAELFVPATVETAGEVALDLEQLATLVAGFSGDAEVAITSDWTTVTVACGDAQVELPTMLVYGLLPTPAIENEIGHVALVQTHFHVLLSRLEFTISKGVSRYSLHGLCLHDSPQSLTGVASDGHRLARIVVPAAGRLPQIIVPRLSVKPLLRLLNRRSFTPITLRSDVELLEVTAPDFRFITKLIAADYPHYQRVIPSATDNAVIVGRAELVQAVAEIAAALPDDRTTKLIGLSWIAGTPALQICSPGMPGIASIVIPAEVSKAGRFAVQIAHIKQLLGALKGGRVRIDSRSGKYSVLITDPDDTDFTIVQMPFTRPAHAVEERAA